MRDNDRRFDRLLHLLRQGAEITGEDVEPFLINWDDWCDRTPLTEKEMMLPRIQNALDEVILFGIIDEITSIGR